MTVSEGEVRFTSDPTRSRFEVFVGERHAGFAHYRLHNGVAHFDHTVVSPEFGGRGLGGQLVGYALAEAISAGWRIQPVCPFVVSYLEKHPELAPYVVD